MKKILVPTGFSKMFQKAILHVRNSAGNMANDLPDAIFHDHPIQNFLGKAFTEKCYQANHILFREI